MILTDREIRIALAKEQIFIDPPPDPLAYSSTAVDLTLSPTVRVFKSAASSIDVDPDREGYDYHNFINMVTDRIELPGSYTLKKGTFLLAWTHEKIKIPNNARLAARVEGRSSLSRLGLGVHVTAPTIHAGFEGPLQLELVNHGPTPVILRPGMRICQLIFELTFGTPEKGYIGQFLGQEA